MENVGIDRENLSEFLEEAELQQYYALFRDILKVSKVSQLKFVVTEDLVQIGMSKPEQRRYKKLYSKYFPNPYLSKIKKLLGTKKTEANCQGLSTVPLEILPFSENIVKSPTKHIISIEDISVNKELGMGQFGVVQLGTWTTGRNQRLQVAIKCLGQERMTSNSTEFLKEAAVMHSIEHPNIVRLYGVVLHMDSLMLVTELAPLRSLLECLREVSLRSNFPVPNLCEFAEQICDGMTYLENKRLIHRDLAARNILVFSKDRVKISDFGLSRALGVGKDYYQTNYNVNLKLPVAWCAPECILYLRFTSSSDVWAFGVCLWEMFSYGFQPWAAFSGQQILEAIDTPNFQRLERPECCPDKYYSLMLECWTHEPTARPKFKELGPKLRSIKPEQVQAISNFVRPEEGRRPNMLEYKVGDIIAILGKENMTKSSLWYGVLPGGTCGMFDLSQTKPYVKVESVKGTPLASISAHPMRQSSRTIRSSLLRSDVKRHTYTGKRTIQRSMISSPQGEVKHTGHVGLDGAYFGDISFLETAGPPRQVVTPYKPSEDMEQQPLINPNSPSHLSGASGSPYSLLTADGTARNGDEIDVAYGDTRTKSHKRQTLKSLSEPATSKKILNKVKCATLGRSHRVEDNAAAKSDEVHEYHEISDTDTESNATDQSKLDNFACPESPGIPKSYGDFGQSLLDEMELMFRSFEGNERNEPSGSGRHADGEMFRSHTLSKSDKKKQAFQTGTLKLMSAGEEKTLATAVAMANELTTKSMNDLDGEQKSPNSPSDRPKFHLKFPQFSLHNPMHSSSLPEKDAVGKLERRNFSEEANSVQDIQSIITEESKHAYTSLIEQPMTSSTVISHMASSPPHSALTMPKPAPRTTRSHFHSLQKHSPRSNVGESDNGMHKNSINELPLPPRNTKPKLVDKPRHVRKYPLKLPAKPVPEPPLKQPIIYQNACRQVPPSMSQKLALLPSASASHLPSTSRFSKAEIVAINMSDGKDMKLDTNPFTSGQSLANPFSSRREWDLHDADCNLDIHYSGGSKDETDHIGNKEGLVKDCSDHVSVEDLLEFADQKPCGRQRGVESDEVRIMGKVLKEQVQSEECLQALEMSDWNVHKAIKLIRVKIAVEEEVSLQECCAELEKAAGDVVEASTALLSIIEIKD